jgi:hypothetical protein
MEGRTLIFDVLNGAIKLSYLMPDLFFNVVNVFFVVLDLNFYLALESFHILYKKSADYSTYLFFIYFLSDFCFLEIHV